MRPHQPSIHVSHAVSVLLTCIALLASSTAAAVNVSAGRPAADQGNLITIEGVNWFGAETSNRVVHGLWIRSMTDMLDQMKSLGFNAVRVPFCPNTLQGVTPNGIDFSKNP